MPVTEILDLPYIGSKNESRCYDLYVPIAVDPNLPLLFFTHGGAWISGNRQQYKPVGIALAKRGFVTAVAGYQITKKGDPEHITFPVHYRDVADGKTNIN
ncbi:Kynurenine formamidase [Globomyces sp. JEL0801]|nr:Kynurenine formamidase [Globomyces sp. JEL0801]